MSSAGNPAGFPDRGEFSEVLAAFVREAKRYLQGLDERNVRDGSLERALDHFTGGLPESGAGAVAALREIVDFGLDASVASAGPRFFHFVTGGATPAALGADLLSSVLDQNAYAWVSSPLAVHLERQSINWLKELFDLPRESTGLITTGATMANFTCLAAARQWWGRRRGVDIGETGLYGQPAVPVISSDYIHASSIKVLGMLGMGRGFTRIRHDDDGRLDLYAMERALDAIDSAPAILVANAGEVNAGAFDPIGAMADLAERHGAWLHVDGAFGLFARVSERTGYLVHGVERADSWTVDGHKWLNVPYDTGFAIVRDGTLLADAFAYAGAYLPGPDDPNPNFGAMGPESSRRARSFPVWATLRAYGRRGVADIVERQLELARRLADLVDSSPDLERLAEVPLNIVCFRFNPGGEDESRLDALNRRLGEAILEDGRVYAGTTTYRGRVALRPALVNWRTRESDVDLLVAVVRELAAGLW